MPRKKRQMEEVNASSMADIAFLLLIFFLVTTTIVSEKGINFVLPPKKDKNIDIELNKRNLFKVLVNSRDQLLVEDAPLLDYKEIRQKAITFITEEADSPQDAIISYRTDRGTSYSLYINVLNELKASYHELRARKMGISREEYLKYDEGSAELSTAMKKKYDEAKKAFPMQLSLAEPTNFETN